MGEYSVRGWHYWPERSEGQYGSRELNIPPYCLTQRSAVIDYCMTYTQLCYLCMLKVLACSYFKIYRQTLTGNNRKLTLHACSLFLPHTCSYPLVWPLSKGELLVQLAS